MDPMKRHTAVHHGVSEFQTWAAAEHAECPGNFCRGDASGEILSGAHKPKFPMIFCPARAQTRRTASGLKPPQWGVINTLSLDWE